MAEFTEEEILAIKAKIVADKAQIALDAKKEEQRVAVVELMKKQSAEMDALKASRQSEIDALAALKAEADVQLASIAVAGVAKPK